MSAPPIERGIADGSVRLDAFVRRHWPALSRRVVRLLIHDGAIRLNGRRATKGTTLSSGDEVTLEAPTDIVADDSRAHVLRHVDDALVVVEKPGGVPGHALDPRQRGTIAGFLLARFPETAAIGDRLAAGLVHRLDTGTSGLLVAARSAESWAALRRAFQRGEVVKTYLVVVAGTPPADTRIDLALAHDPRDRRRMIPAAGTLRAWAACTEVTVRTPGARRSLVVATMRSGVTHQIRAHLAAIGHPVVGDALYDGPTAPLPIGRHALHAAALEFPHPVTGERLRVESPLPADLAALLD